MTLEHSRTPRMTRHALERCQEMGIPARVAKNIFRHPAVVRPSRGSGKPGPWPVYMVTSDDHPEYAIVVADQPDAAWVITVVFRTTETYARQGTTYTTKET